MHHLDLSTVTEPALRGLRFMFACVCVLVLAACATSPEPEEPRPGPLIDNSAETDYFLEDVAERLHEADYQASLGRRTLASALYDAAHDMLPEDAVSERRYVRLLQATVWASPGPDQDLERASELSKAASADLSGAAAGRIAADTYLVEALIAIGRGELESAHESAVRADESFVGVNAHARRVDAAIGIAAEFLRAGAESRAEHWARHAHEVSLRLDDDGFHMRTCVEIAALVPAMRDRWLHEAYEATFRIGAEEWLQAVVAAAVGQWYDAGEWREVVRWGDRVRERESNRFPPMERVGLYEDDWFRMLVRYADARLNAGMVDARAREALELADELLAKLQRGRGDGLGVWEEKLRAGLLQFAED